MARIIPFKTDPHQETQTLLPWYVTGRLEDEDLAAVEAHLRDCPACQAELKLERRLEEAVAGLPFDVEQGWQSLRQRLNPAPRRGRLVVALRSAFGGGRAATWTIAAQAALVLIVAGLALPQAMRGTAPSVDPVYHALAAPAAPASAGDVIVVFRPDATAQDLTQAIRDAGARLVDGPTEADAYVLAVPANAQATALKRLRETPCVTLAEPISPAGPS